MANAQMGVCRVIERPHELEANAAVSADSSPELTEYNRVRAEQGLNAALS